MKSMRNYPEVPDSALWKRGPAVPKLAHDRVHIWSAGLDSVATFRTWLETLLSCDERARAERFRRDVDRGQFVLTRGILRALLARYLGCEPADVRFRYGHDGKPALLQDVAGGLRFNVSHAAGVALYAIGGDREVGIDVERLTPDSPERRALLQRWTRMEAYVKACGTSIAALVDAAHFGLLDVDAVVRRQGWICAEVPLPGCVAAMAVQGSGWMANYWSLDANWLAASSAEGREDAATA